MIYQANRVELLIKSLDFWTKLQSFFTSVSLQNNVNCSLAQRTVWRPHFANAVSSLLFWSPASGSGFGGLWGCRSASVLYYYVLLSRFLTIHPYSRAEVLLTFLAYINRKSFWLLSDEDKAVWKYLVDTKFWKNKLKTLKLGPKILS